MNEDQFRQIAVAVACEQALLRCVASVLLANSARQHADTKGAFRDLIEELHATIDTYQFVSGSWVATEVLRQSVRRGADAISDLAATHL